MLQAVLSVRGGNCSGRYCHASRDFRYRGSDSSPGPNDCRLRSILSSLDLVIFLPGAVPPPARVVDNSPSHRYDAGFLVERRPSAKAPFRSYFHFPPEVPLRCVSSRLDRLDGCECRGVATCRDCCCSDVSNMGPLSEAFERPKGHRSSYQSRTWRTSRVWLPLSAARCALVRPARYCKQQWCPARHLSVCYQANRVPRGVEGGIKKYEGNSR